MSRGRTCVAADAVSASWFGGGAVIDGAAMGRIAILALAAALALPARADDAPVPPVATLRVGVPAGPDAVAGFDRDIFAEAAREAGLGVVFAVMPPGTALAALDAGRLDVAAGPFPPGAASGRRALVPVAGDGDALLKRRGDGGLGVPRDAAGKLVGTLGPAAGEARLRAAAAALQARLAPRRPAFPDPLADLASGRVAALAGALPEVAAAALARPDLYEVVGPAFGTTVRLAPVSRADRPDLAARLDAALGRMRADGRLAGAQRRWFGLAFDPPAGQPVSTSNR